MGLAKFITGLKE